MSRQANWGAKQKKEVLKQFNLFTSTNGEEGWDPEKWGDTDYIVGKAKDNPICVRYLSKRQGGHQSNRDNQKVVRGYKNAASEYWVHLAKTGIRRSTFGRC